MFVFDFIFHAQGNETKPNRDSKISGIMAPSPAPTPGPTHCSADFTVHENATCPNATKVFLISALVCVHVAVIPEHDFHFDDSFPTK